MTDWMVLRLKQAAEKMEPDLMLAIDNGEVSLMIAVRMCRLSRERQRELLPEARRVTEFLKMLER